MLPPTLPTIDQPPVTLRPFIDADAALVVSVADDPLIPLITTVPTSGSEADVQAYLERQHQRLPDGMGYSLAIADHDSGEAVGQIGLWLRDIDDGRVSVGYWIVRQHRRKGYARAALEAITLWGSAIDEVHRLQLYVEPWNEGSWRTAEACGYVREGLLRSWEDVGGRRTDMYMYSYLA